MPHSRCFYGTRPATHKLKTSCAVVRVRVTISFCRRTTQNTGGAQNESEASRQSHPSTPPRVRRVERLFVVSEKRTNHRRLQFALLLRHPPPKLMRCIYHVYTYHLCSVNLSVGTAAAATPTRGAIRSKKRPKLVGEIKK